MDEPIPVLRSVLLTRAGFSHAFTTRAGGVSEPPFDSLDFAILRNHDARRENERRLARAVGFDAGRFYQARQVHGATVVVCGGPRDAMLSVEADALVGEPASGAAVAVRVADCVPVLVADPRSGRVAAVHAGWRGVVAGVLEAAVRAMCDAPRAAAAETGAAAAFVAAIGPCIGPCCFEVGLDVAGLVASFSGDGEVVAGRDEARSKAFVDLRVAVRRRLQASGLPAARIDDVPGCTRCDAARFYSFRRDGDGAGRQLGAIVAR